MCCKLTGCGVLIAACCIVDNKVNISSGQESRVLTTAFYKKYISFGRRPEEKAFILGGLIQ